MQIGDRVRVREGQLVHGMGTAGRITHLEKKSYATYLGIDWEDEDYYLPPDPAAYWDSDRFELIPEDLECATIGEGLLLEKVTERVAGEIRRVAGLFRAEAESLEGVIETTVEFGVTLIGETGLKGILTASGEGDVRVSMKIPGALYAG